MAGVSVSGGLSITEIILALLFIEVQVALIVAYVYMRRVAAWLNGVGVMLGELYKKLSTIKIPKMLGGGGEPGKEGGGGGGPLDLIGGVMNMFGGR